MVYAIVVFPVPPDPLIQNIEPFGMAGPLRDETLNVHCSVDLSKDRFEQECPPWYRQDMGPDLWIQIEQHRYKVDRDLSHVSSGVGVARKAQAITFALQFRPL